MRRRVLGALATVAALGALAAPVRATPAIQGATFVSGSVFSILPAPGAKHIREAEVPLFVSGTLSVTFHSDPASGCTALAGCEYSGTIVYKPSGAQLIEVSYRLHGHTHREATVILGSLSSSGGDESYARVIRQVGGATTGVCADTNPAGGFLPGHRSGARFAFRLAAGLSSTRCAGPLPSDLARALPVLRLAVPARRGTHADLRKTTSFAGHGFAGTVSSTLRFTVGRSSSPASGSVLPPGTHIRRIRYVQRDVRVAAETGTLIFDVRGTPDGAVCILLDSCGLTGTMTLTPRLAGVSGSISTAGPASLPEADYARALLGRGPRRPVSGELGSGNAGAVFTSVRQSAACTDTASGGAGGLVLVTSAGRLQVRYGAQGGLFSGAGADRSRCPGPELALQGTLASGSVARAALGAHMITIVLRAGRAFQDDGYSVTPRGRVTLRLRFGRVSQTVFKAPSP